MQREPCCKYNTMNVCMYVCLYGCMCVYLCVYKLEYLDMYAGIKYNCIKSCLPGNDVLIILFTVSMDGNIWMKPAYKITLVTREIVEYWMLCCEKPW